MFTNPSLININEIANMPKRCTNCNQDFVIEPGFYFGAMFVSYGLTCVLLFLSLGVSLLLYGYVSRTWLYTTIGAMLFFYTYFFRVSRVIWINIAIFFDDNILNL